MSLGAHQEAQRGEWAPCAAIQRQVTVIMCGLFLHRKMKANGFWTMANINALLQHTPTESGRKAEKKGAL